MLDEAELPGRQGRLLFGYLATNLHRLRDEPGARPSPDIEQLHLSILRGEMRH